MILEAGKIPILLESVPQKQNDIPDTVQALANGDDDDLAEG